METEKINLTINAEWLKPVEVQRIFKLSPGKLWQLVADGYLNTYRPELGAGVTNRLTRFKYAEVEAFFNSGASPRFLSGPELLRYVQWLLATDKRACEENGASATESFQLGEWSAMADECKNLLEVFDYVEQHGIPRNPNGSFVHPDFLNCLAGRFLLNQPTVPECY